MQAAHRTAGDAAPTGSGEGTPAAWRPAASASRWPRRNRFATLPASFAADIPVYIPVFNNPSYARLMIGQLRAHGTRNIFLVDNASTAPEMHAFLEEAEREVTVIALDQNRGPHHILDEPMSFACLPEYFCITDPDIQFHPEMPEGFLLELLQLTNTFELGKAGLALDISDRADMRLDKYVHPITRQSYHIWEWEEQFWREQVATLEDGTPVYKGGIDTTFALYNKKYFRHETFYEAVRIAGRYTARHLPWYKDTAMPAAEERDYRSSQRWSSIMS